MNPNARFTPLDLNLANAYAPMTQIIVPTNRVTPIIITVLTLCIPFTLWRLTSFDLVYSMTSGGPGEDTSLIAYRITMEAFTNFMTQIIVPTNRVTPIIITVLPTFANNPTFSIKNL